MDYTSVGLMSGSSLDGLDIVCANFRLKDKWSYKILAAETTEFKPSMRKQLMEARDLPAEQYLLFHIAFGKYCGEMVTAFLKRNMIRKRIDIIGSHGHTTFHLPGKNMTHQLGDGAAIAAASGISVVSDLRALDIALGGQGAPIVPIGEALLFSGYRYYLNIGGIANISIHGLKNVVAFDVCAANRVLNILSAKLGKKYDKDGRLAAGGSVNPDLLEKLDSLKYYSQPYPKSLANEFGTGVVIPLIEKAGISTKDALATYCEHIARQLKKSLLSFQKSKREKLFVTGGGAFNQYLIQRCAFYLADMGIDITVPAPDIINYKEALIMAFMAVLRIRDEVNVIKTVTGARKNSIGGALWNAK